MEYIYAAMLLSEAGKEITDHSLNAVLKAAGINADEAKAKAVADSLKGVDIKEVIKNAQAMQVAAPAASPAAGGAAPAQGAKKEKKEEAKSEEEAASGLSGLFG